MVGQLVSGERRLRLRPKAPQRGPRPLVAQLRGKILQQFCHAPVPFPWIGVADDMIALPHEFRIGVALRKQGEMRPHRRPGEFDDLIEQRYE